jgi:exosortase family protein XrtF
MIIYAKVFIKPVSISIFLLKIFLCMSIFKKNKAFFIFLAKFALSYLLLSGIYWLYLSQYDAAKFEPDGMTRIVAEQSRDIGQWLGEDVNILPHTKEASYKVFVNNKFVARVVEGCNAVSVMILFTAFIIAFSTTFKRTSLYIIAGILVIHVLNVIRVGMLSLGFYYYYDYRELLHDILFPVFIYGVVFVLWVLWVTKFSGNAAKVQN